MVRNAGNGRIAHTVGMACTVLAMVHMCSPCAMCTVLAMVCSGCMIAGIMGCVALFTVVDGDAAEP